jgi:hypothetical protein
MRKIILTCWFGVLGASWAWAQTPAPAAQTDTVRAVKKAEAAEAAPDDQEIDLEAIEIQAVIEKPNVDIISKRSKPEWEETRFIDRSFEAELKQAPKDLMLVDEELDRAQKLDALKKAEPPPKKE